MAEQPNATVLQELREQVQVLQQRVARLEDEVSDLRGSRVPIAQTGPEPMEAVEPVPLRQSAALLSSARRPSLENRIGSQVFNRVGIFAVLAAVAWFLKLAIDRDWIGPWPRVLVGMAVAVGLAMWSERFRRGGFAAFSHTLKALGTGIAYLSVWTAYSVYHLLAAGLALLLMLLVTVANSWLAWRQDSALLAGYALAGGLATPALLWTGGNHEMVLFSYLLLLDGAVVVLARLRGWTQLVPAAFAGTAIYYTVWWWLSFGRRDLLLTGVFVGLFFLLFAAAPGVLLARAAMGRRREWLVLLPIANGLAGFLAGQHLVSWAGAPNNAGWVSLAVAAVFAGLLRLQGRTEALRLLWQVHAGLAAGFVALAIPLAFDGSAVVLLWLGEALVLAWIAGRSTEPVLHVCAFGLVALSAAGVVALPWTDPLRQPVAVLLNPHFATAAVACAVFVTTIWLTRSDGRSTGWNLLRATAVVAFSVVAIVAVSVEIHHYWACGGRVGMDLCGAQASGAHHEIYSRFTYSAWYMLYGAGLIAVGFLRRSAFLRWQALVLLALSIGKVFLFDASGLSSIYRVLSFLGLGVLLLAVSFAYQRDWLALRQDEQP